MAEARAGEVGQGGGERVAEEWSLMPQGGVCPREDLEGTVTTAAAQT